MEFSVILSTIFVVLVQSLSCQELVAVEVEAKLTFATFNHFSLYDGNDTIFILGGMPDSKIYSYTLSRDILTELTTFPNKTQDGFATFNDQGDIVHIGGTNSTGSPDGNIYKLELNSSNLKVVQTNLKFGEGRGMKGLDGSNALFISADRGDMYCMDLSTFVNCEGARLRTSYVTVRPFVYDGHAYLTGTLPAWPRPGGIIEKVNLETLESELIVTGLPDLNGHELVFDGKYAYIIGGNKFSTSGIIRLNPQTMEQEFFHVDNFPLSPTFPNSYWWGGSAVYVEKLNRIYFSGGLTAPESLHRNEIWYIDLAPISEPFNKTK